MSSDSQEEFTRERGELAREFRQFHGLAASFFRTAANHVGMTVTDMQVIDILDTIGPTTAGQLADLTGLTTGAITGMLNRLEEAGLVQRARDPDDGRRVIVHLARDKDAMREIDALFSSLDQAWNDLASRYDKKQLAFLLQVLQDTNALSRNAITRLRESPSDAKEVFSTPLGDLESGRLVVSSAVSILTVRADNKLLDLYQARFVGSLPDVKAKDGVVTIRYPRRLWTLGREQRSAQVSLNTSIPWRITIQGGASVVTTKLDGLDLSSLEVKGGLSSIHLSLPTPTSIVPIRISGSASDITIKRPTHVPARAHLKGWVSTFIFDDQTFSNVGNDAHLHSRDYQADLPSYDIEVSSSASMITITADL